MSGLVKRGIPTHISIKPSFFDLVVTSSSLPGELDKSTITNNPTISIISCFKKKNTLIPRRSEFHLMTSKISLPCLPIMILAISQKAEDRRGAKSWVQKEEGAGLIRKLKVPRKNCFLFRIRSFHCSPIFFLVQCL